MSFARGVTFWPGATAILMATASRRLDPSALSVSSTITTASAPSGTGAPVRSRRIRQVRAAAAPRHP